MKYTFLTLCLILFFTTLVDAGVLYECRDMQGNIVITDNPQAGIKKCKYLETQSSSEEPSPSEQKEAVEKKEDKSGNSKEMSQERAERINKCIKCCNEKVDSCYNYTADSRLCMAENKSCSDMCKSEGSSSSKWSQCWSQSK